MALALPLAGFAVGWALAGDADWLLASREEPQPTTPEETPRPQNTSIPSEDVTGSDIPGLSRYPGSVRIEYLREDQGEFVWTEVEYLTDANLSQVREFHRDAFRAEEWSVNDVGFAQNSWTFFVVKGEREVFVELKPRGEIVEIDIEQTEPQEERSQKEPRKADQGDNYQNSGAQNSGARSNGQPAQPPAPNPEPAAPAPAAVSAPAPATPTPAPVTPVAVPATPAPVAPAPITPAPAPAPPVYDDDFDDGDFDDGYDDDGIDDGLEYDD